MRCGSSTQMAMADTPFGLIRLRLEAAETARSEVESLPSRSTAAQSRVDEAFGRNPPDREVRERGHRTGVVSNASSCPLPRLARDEQPVDASRSRPTARPATRKPGDHVTVRSFRSPNAQDERVLGLLSTDSAQRSSDTRSERCERTVRAIFNGGFGICG